MAEFRRDVEKLAREWAAMEKEAQSAAQACQALIAEYHSTRQTAAKVKRAYDETKALCEAERTQSAETIAKQESALQKARAQVDPKLVARYAAARKHFSMPVVPVAGQKCSGCNMSLPVLMIRHLSAEGEIAECENCGRLLYTETE
jgi:predicted  nucleic acid-binding Zn-ribbon protein